MNTKYDSSSLKKSVTKSEGKPRSSEKSILNLASLSYVKTLDNTKNITSNSLIGLVFDNSLTSDSYILVTSDTNLTSISHILQTHEKNIGSNSLVMALGYLAPSIPEITDVRYSYIKPILRKDTKTMAKPKIRTRYKKRGYIVDSY